MAGYFALYGVVFILGILLIMFQKKKTLTTAEKKKFHTYLQKIQNIASLEQQIIESDKLYHQILKAYKYKGTFGEILKQKPRVIDNIQNIWDLHKLRNTLVHELTDTSQGILKKKSNSYQKEISQLLNK